MFLLFTRTPWFNFRFLFSRARPWKNMYKVSGQPREPYANEANLADTADRTSRVKIVRLGFKKGASLALLRDAMANWCDFLRHKSPTSKWNRWNSPSPPPVQSCRIIVIYYFTLIFSPDTHLSWTLTVNHPFAPCLTHIGHTLQQFSFFYYYCIVLYY